ncbi:MAG TPA: TetR/AcrR family transcriptional regulator [Acidimicrobiales bacterium]|nr:TetR/AcrR family transcriptional regulator [Acidimicrobiales bacterium]
MTAQEVEVDGRRLRREQNREAVIDALLALFGEGNYSPSAAEIAERAGISARSLFRYFDDVDDLNRAAIERQLATIGPLRDPGVGADAPTTAKIDALVASRVRMHEAAGGAARAARACAHRHPVIAAQLEDARRYLRRQIIRLFEPEAGDQPALLAVLDALCSFETYELLRHGNGLSTARTEAALVEAMTALLQPEETR